MRTAYLGTSEFAAVVLRRLTESPHRPALVVTPPDRRRGRGRKLSSPPAAETARELGLALHQTASVNEPGSVQALRAADPRAVGVCAFGQLISEPLLSELIMLNVHPSLIPRWRGAAPIERAIMAGDDYRSLSARLAALGGELLVRSLDRLEAGELEFTDQEEEQASYAAKIAPEERRLDPSRPAAELERIVRALTPHIGAFLELEGGGRLGVRAGRAVENGPGPGEIEPRDGELVLGCSEGALLLERVQAPGGKAMSAPDFLRGHPTPGRAV